MKKQQRMFGEETLPLFSGTPQRGEAQAFIPTQVAQQDAMFCPVCKGVGTVERDGKTVRCTCGYGQPFGGVK